MFSFTTAAISALAALTAVNAIVVPQEPSGATVVKTGSALAISWELDTADGWTDMTIELMTGTNLEMIHLDYIAQHIDGTVQNNYSYVVPPVSPNAAVYFLQFTNTGKADKTWTTRFTIADADGKTTQPTKTLTGTDGKTTPYDNGVLLNGSNATTPSVSPTSNSSASDSVSMTASLSAGSASETASKSDSASSSGGPKAASLAASTTNSGSSSQTAVAALSGAGSVRPVAALAVAGLVAGLVTSL